MNRGREQGGVVVAVDDVAGSGQRARHAHQNRLGHPAVDETLRQGLLEQIDLALAREVGAEAEDLGTGPGQLEQRVP